MSELLSGRICLKQREFLTQGAASVAALLLAKTTLRFSGCNDEEQGKDDRTCCKKTKEAQNIFSCP